MTTAPHAPAIGGEGALLSGVGHLLDYLEERATYLTMAGGQRWEALHSLWPVLYHASERDASVRQRCAALVAPFAQWQHAYHSTVARNILVLQEAAKVVRALERQGICSILVKGAALAESVYPDVGLRTMSDVDLLLRREDVSQAARALAAMGYGLQEPPPGRLGAAGRVDLAAQEWRKDLAGGYFAVDLHWHLLGDGRLRAAFPRFLSEEVWQRAQSTRVAGQRALVLEPEDALPYLCLQQLAWHPWSHPLGYLDLHLLVELERTRIDWDILSSRAARWGLGTVVSRACAWTHRLFGTDFGDRLLLASVPGDGLRSWLIDGLAGDDLLGLRERAGQTERRDVLVLLLAEWQGAGGFLRSLVLPGTSGVGTSPHPSLLVSLRYWCTLLLHAFRVAWALLPWNGARSGS